MFFPFTSFFWFCLVQVSTTQFCSFPFLIARVSDGTNVPISLAPASSLNLVSPDGSLPDLEGVGSHSTSIMEEKFEVMLTKRLAQFEVHFAALASIPMLVQGFSRFENSVLSLTQSIDGLAARVAAWCGLCFKRFRLGKILECTWT